MGETIVAKLACRADLCYNEALNIVVPWSAANTRKALIHLYRRRIMDTIPQDNTPHKQCTGECKQWFPATSEFFSPRKDAKDGLRSQCKECRNKEQKSYHARPDVQERRRARASRPEARERDRIQHRASYQIPEVRKQIRAQQKAYYEEVREQRLAYRKAYYSQPENRERQRAQFKDYYSRPEVRAYRNAHDKAYKKTYLKRPEVRERNQVNSHNYRARKSAIPGTYSPAQIQDLLKRQRYKCYYCHLKFEKRSGKYIYHIDHTFPVSRVAGTDIPANDISYLVLACPTCNRKKHNKFPWEFPAGGRLL